MSPCTKINMAANQAELFMCSNIFAEKKKKTKKFSEILDEETGQSLRTGAERTSDFRLRCFLKLRLLTCQTLHD